MADIQILSDNCSTNQFALSNTPHGPLQPSQLKEMTLTAVILPYR